MFLVYENVGIVKAEALALLQWINNISYNFYVNDLSLLPHFAFKQTRKKNLTY